MGRQKRGSQLRDHLPLENSPPATVSQSIAVTENQTLNGQALPEIASTRRKQESEEDLKLTENTSNQTRSGQRQSSATSDEYQRGGGCGRRTSNRSSRGKDSRYAAAAVVQVRERPTAGSGNSRKSEVTQRTIRNETRQTAVDHQQVVARTIYTSDRRVRSVEDSTTERLMSPSAVALTPVTGSVASYYHI